ncbi:hypothetical protein ACMYSQ_002329 [Aspergillus niger]
MELNECAHLVVAEKLPPPEQQSIHNGVLLKPNTNTNQPACISPADLIPMTADFSCSCIQDQQPELRVIGSIICVRCDARVPSDLSYAESESVHLKRLPSEG